MRVTSSNVIKCSFGFSTLTLYHDWPVELLGPVIFENLSTLNPNFSARVIKLDGTVSSLHPPTNTFQDPPHILPVSRLTAVQERLNVVKSGSPQSRGGRRERSFFLPNRPPAQSAYGSERRRRLDQKRSPSTIKPGLFEGYTSYEGPYPRVTEAFLFGGLSPPNKRSVSLRPPRLCAENPILDKSDLAH